MQVEERTPALEVTTVPAPQGYSRFVPSMYAIAVFAVFAAVFIVAMTPRADTDFWWHLKVGQYIAEHHVVPSRDFMSYTFYGRPWTDHEWLAELMLYGLYRLGGLWAQIVVYAAVICAAFGLVYLRMLRLGTNRVLALFVLTAAFFASTASWGVRIQMLSLFFIALFMFLLDGFHRTRDRRYLVALPFLMLIWTNLHGEFVLGIVLIGITLVGEILNRVTRQDGALGQDGLKALAVALVAAFAVTIVNPNGIRQLLYPLQFILPNAYTDQIQESASPNFHMPVIMVFEVLVLLLVAAVFVRRPKMNWTQLLLIVAFTHLAFSAVRNVPAWCVVVAPFVALYLQGDGLPRRGRQLQSKIVPVLNGIFLVMVLAVYGTLADRFVNAQALAAAQRGSFPTGAVAYMKVHPLPPHVFCTYAWGGYLLWNLFPQYRDFMDSRADTLFNAKILHAYDAIYAASPDWRSLLNSYHVQDVLVEPAAPIAQVLALSPGWRRAYHDGSSVLYTRLRAGGGLEQPGG